MELVKQQVVVGADGRITIQVPQLPPGTRAEVTVVEQGERSEKVRPIRRSSLIASCPDMFGSTQEADEFLSQERDAWDL